MQFLHVSIQEAVAEVRLHRGKVGFRMRCLDSCVLRR
jgi:hypothetical protein